MRFVRRCVRKEEWLKRTTEPIRVQLTMSGEARIVAFILTMLGPLYMSERVQILRSVIAYFQVVL